MLKRETEIKNRITLKGILTSIGTNELEVMDEKTNEVDTLNIVRDLDMFLGKSVSIVLSDSVKKEFETEDADE